MTMGNMALERKSLSLATKDILCLVLHFDNVNLTWDGQVKILLAQVSLFLTAICISLSNYVLVRDSHNKKCSPYCSMLYYQTFVLSTPDFDVFLSFKSRTVETQAICTMAYVKMMATQLMEVKSVISVTLDTFSVVLVNENVKLMGNGVAQNLFAIVSLVSSFSSQS